MALSKVKLLLITSIIASLFTYCCFRFTTHPERLNVLVSRHQSLAFIQRSDQITLRSEPLKSIASKTPWDWFSVSVRVWELVRLFVQSQLHSPCFSDQNEYNIAQKTYKFSYLKPLLIYGVVIEYFVFKVPQNQRYVKLNIGERKWGLFWDWYMQLNPVTLPHCYAFTSDTWKQLRYSKTELNDCWR